MIIEMIEQEYPHVTRARHEGDTGLLSYFGSKGARVSASRRQRRTQALPTLFAVDLDPLKEFPQHIVLYRGPRFCLLQKRRFQRSRKKTGFSKKEFDALCALLHKQKLSREARSRQRLLASLSIPGAFAEECWKRDQEAHLNTHPID